MDKHSSSYEVPNGSYSSYFGVIFKKIKYETFSARYISTIYKILTIIFYLFSRVQKEILKIPTHIIQKNIYHALHAGHIYGMFYYRKCDRQWIDIICKKNNISPTEKILFGFSGVFKTKKRVFSLDGIPWFEKSIFILFSSLILSNSLFLLLYSFFIILAKSSLQNTLGLIVSWMLYTYICFIIIQIIKGSCWDANNLFKKYR